MIINGDSLKCVDKIYDRLYEIPKIKYISVYFRRDDIPSKYKGRVAVEELDRLGEAYTTDYQLILYNENKEEEVLVESANCGYGGTGPYATDSILQILDIKIDYGIIYEKKKIEMLEVNQYHDLGVFVSNIDKPLIIRAKFKSAYSKWDTMKKLFILGTRGGLPKEIENRCFNTSYNYLFDKELENYKTNNLLIIDEGLKRIGHEGIEIVIEKILKDNSFEYTIDEYKSK